MCFPEGSSVATEICILLMTEQAPFVFLQDCCKQGQGDWWVLYDTFTVAVFTNSVLSASLAILTVRVAG